MLGMAGFASLSRVVAVFEWHCRQREVHHPGFPWRQFPPLLVADVHRPHDRLAHGATMLEPIARLHVCEAVHLGAAVVLDQDWTPPFDHLLLDRDRTGCRAMDGDLMAGQVEAGAVVVRKPQ